MSAVVKRATGSCRMRSTFPKSTCVERSSPLPEDALVALRPQRGGGCDAAAARSAAGEWAQLCVESSARAVEGSLQSPSREHEPPDGALQTRLALRTRTQARQQSTQTNVANSGSVRKR